jgi:hypothetical protein
LAWAVRPPFPSGQSNRKALKIEAIAFTMVVGGWTDGAELAKFVRRI